MEKQNLTLDYIKVTPELIRTINQLQTGGTDHFNLPIEDKFFDNCSLKSRVVELTELNDFIVDVYADYPDFFDETKFSKMLINIKNIKTLLIGLAAPQQ